VRVAGVASADPAPSPWLADAPKVAPAPPLSGERRVDVAVVGAGLTGLSTALALRAEGLSVALLEREQAGFGASGRNAGHLTPTIGKDLPTLLRVFGRERAARLARLAESAIGHVEATLEQLGIACDYVPAGNVIAAVHASQHARLERAAEAARALGLAAEWLSPEAMRARGLPGAFTAGVLEPRGGVLDPARFVRGLRAAALEAGAELYEHTPLLRIEQGRRLSLRAPAGRLIAERAVLATNAFTPELGWLASRVQPMVVSLFRTAPLSAAQRAELGWRGREGLYTAHEALESYRLTADGRIVGGARYARAGFGRRSASEIHPPTFRALERRFRERFPGLDVPIERFWSGPIAFTLDFLPLVGRGGRHGNVWHAVAYAGHGLALASYAGPMLADAMAGRDGPGRVLVERRCPPLPPEPLRWLVARGITAGFDWLDRRTDRLARAARRPGP
jgi:glycine/D-amino acid oxidase-like deaminating enzyme